MTWPTLSRSRTAAAEIEDALGPLDVWVNNAMVSVFSPFHEMSVEEFRRVTDVTYLGAVYGTMAALRRMRSRGGGAIIQVGSALAYRAISLQSAYCGAKHALQGFTEALRCELLHDGIPVRLTMVNLPALNTPQFDWVKSRLPGEPQPVPPIFEPEVAASAIVWASDRHAREVNVGASTVMALWADKLIPGFADRYLARTGYEAQQTNQPAAADRPDNLWKPLPGDWGARGRFSSRARTWSLQTWAALHRPTLLATGAGAALALLRGRRLGSGARRIRADEG